jgi:hypothetical protein
MPCIRQCCNYKSSMYHTRECSIVVEYSQLVMSLHHQLKPHANLLLRPNPSCASLNGMVKVFCCNLFNHRWLIASYSGIFSVADALSSAGRYIKHVCLVHRHHQLRKHHQDSSCPCGALASKPPKPHTPLDILVRPTVRPRLPRTREPRSVPKLNVRAIE